jgi:putative membrane protein
MATFSKSDHELLQHAIADAENRTGAHLALVVVPVSDRYLMYPLAYGAFCGLALGGAIALFWPHFPLRLAFVAEATLFAALSIAFDWLPLRLMLVPRAIRRARARQLAHREFAARILTTHRGGLLLFVSEGERAIELLADRDLHARVGQQAWDRIVGEMMSSASTKPLTECLLAAIASCSAAIQASGRTLH